MTFPSALGEMDVLGGGANMYSFSLQVSSAKINRREKPLPGSHDNDDLARGRGG